MINKINSIKFAYIIGGVVVSFWLLCYCCRTTVETIVFERKESSRVAGMIGPITIRPAVVGLYTMCRATIQAQCTASIVRTQYTVQCSGIVTDCQPAADANLISTK